MFLIKFEVAEFVLGDGKCGFGETQINCLPSHCPQAECVTKHSVLKGFN